MSSEVIVRNAEVPTTDDEANARPAFQVLALTQPFVQFWPSMQPSLNHWQFGQGSVQLTVCVGDVLPKRDRVRAVMR